MPDGSMNTQTAAACASPSTAGKAYGVYLVGGAHNMSPAYEEGDMLTVNRDLSVRPGDDCIFLCGDGDGAPLFLVKRLLRLTPEKWHVRQFDPPKDFDLERSQWQEAHRVTGKYCR